MNNIFKKNIIKNAETQNTLPHSTEFDVALKTNQILHAALNYSLQKLLDNDMFIERKLICESNYTIGPIKKIDGEVAQYVDNAKMFDGIDGNENALSLVQKIPYDLSATIQKTLDVSVSFFYDDVDYFASTSYALYRANNLMDQWQKVTDISGLPTDCIVKHMSPLSDDIILTTDDKVYKLVRINDSLETNTVVLSAKPILDKNIEPKLSSEKNNVVAISGDNMFVGNTNSLYCLTKTASGNYSAPVKENINNGSIKFIEFLSNDTSNNEVLAAGEMGLFAAKKKFAFYDVDNIADDDGNIIDFGNPKYAIQFGNNLFISEILGLSCYNGNKLITANDLSTAMINKVVQLTIGESQLLYACTRNDGIWKLTVNENSFIAEKIFSNKFVGNVVDVAVTNGNTYIATTDRILWTAGNIDNIGSNPTWYENDNLDGENIVSLLPSNEKLYICTTNNIFILDAEETFTYTTEDTLSSISADIPDITTIYFDDDQKMMIGTVSGLYDINFNPLLVTRLDVQQALDSTTTYNQAEQVQITSYINKVRYLNFEGKELWCVCTDNGVYMLQYNAQMKEWNLNSLHILEGKNITDIIYDTYTGTICAASDDDSESKLYCLTIPKDILYSETLAENAWSLALYQYILDVNHYTQSNAEYPVKALATLEGKILALETVSPIENVVALYTSYENIAPNLVKTTYLPDNSIKHIQSLKTFANNQYTDETYAIERNASTGKIYRYYTDFSSPDQRRYFRQLSANVDELISMGDKKIDYLLAYRYCVNGNIPKMFKELPSDRYSEIMLVTDGDNKISAYDFYDMKLSAYKNNVARNDSETLVNNLQLFHAKNNKDNVGTEIFQMQHNVCGFDYIVDTFSTDVKVQQQNMIAVVATEKELMFIPAQFNAYERLSTGNDAAGATLPQFSKFSLIPYLNSNNNDRRTCWYVGIGSSKAYIYNEAENDFDVGMLSCLSANVRNTVLENADFTSYAFSFDDPFTTDETILSNRKSSDANLMFMVFGTNEGPAATILNYNGDNTTKWFKNFQLVDMKQVDGEEPELLPIVDVYREKEDSYIYAATQNNVYYLAITDVSLDENNSGKLAFNNGFKKIPVDFNDISQILVIDKKIYVLDVVDNKKILYSINENTSTTKTQLFHDLDVELSITTLPGQKKIIYSTPNSYVGVYEISSNTTKHITTQVFKQLQNADGDIYNEIHDHDFIANNMFVQHDFIDDKDYIYFSSLYNEDNYFLSGLSKYDCNSSCSATVDFDYTTMIETESNSIDYTQLFDITQYIARLADLGDITKNNQHDQYGTTYMLFTGDGIYSTSYGFSLDNLKKLLDLNVANSSAVKLSSFAEFGMTESSKVTCLETAVFSKTIKDPPDDLENPNNTPLDQVVVDMHISMMAIGTTNGLMTYIPNKGFGKITGNLLVTTQEIVSIAINEYNITAISKDQTGKRYITQIPINIYINKTIEFDISNAQETVLNDDIVPSTICFFTDVNAYVVGQTMPQKYNTLLIATDNSNGIYTIDFDIKLKDREEFTTANILYQADGGIIIARGNTLSSYPCFPTTDVYSDTTTKVYTTSGDVKIIYEDSSLDVVNYGSIKGAFQIFTDTDIQQPLDNRANILLDGKNLESIYYNNSEVYYELKNSDEKHEIVKLAKHIVETPVVLNEMSKLYNSHYGLSNLYNIDNSTLLAVCSTPQLVNKQDGSSSDYASNITPGMSISKFWKYGNAEYAIAEGKLFRKLASQNTFTQIDLENPIVELAANSLKYVSNKYIVDSNAGVVCYNNIQNVRYYSELLKNMNINAMYKLDENVFLIGTTKGLYKYFDGNLIRCNAMYNMPVDSISLATTNSAGQRTFFITSGSEVYTTLDENFAIAAILFDLSRYGTNITTITGVKKFGNKRYVFGTNIGVLNTYDKYYLVDTWAKQTTGGISRAIKECYDNFIQQHIQQYHAADSDIITVNDTLVPIDMSGIDINWQKTTNNKTIILNDYVDSVEFNGDVSYITAKYSNYSTQYDSKLSANSYQDLSGISYIMKTYKSNIKELYINIPSTNTYYINHISGMQYCTHNHYAFRRTNSDSDLSGTPDDLCTKLRVFIDKKHFDFSEIYNVFINGNSLPLKIFTDKEKHDAGESQQYYHSYILPSLVTSMPLVPTVGDVEYSLQNISGDLMYFDFKCFGTDAQSIKIIAKSPNKYKIVFNSNGATSGQMDDIVVKEDQHINLPDCTYIRDGYVFKGWALSENGAAKYTNRENIVNLAENNNAVIILYATWKYYSFDSSTDTVLTIASNKTEFLLAASEPVENASNVVVDYDYAGDTVLTIDGNGQQFQIASGTLMPSESNVVVEFED